MTGISNLDNTQLGQANGVADLDSGGQVPLARLGHSPSGGVPSFNTRTGAITLSKADVTATGLAAADVSAASTSHAQALHGRGGTDTMLNGLEVSDQSAQQANHAFIFGPRTTTALTTPVPTIQPKVSGLPCALDIAPSPTPTISTNNGYAWIDICDQDVIDQNPYNGYTLRLANQGTFAEISTRLLGTGGSHNGGSAISLFIGSNYTGTGNPQIELTPMAVGNPSVCLGFDGSSVRVGKLTSNPMATTATTGYFSITACAGAPTGTPHYVGTGEIPIQIDTTNSKFWAYIGGAWKGVVLA